MHASKTRHLILTMAAESVLTAEDDTAWSAQHKRVSMEVGAKNVIRHPIRDSAANETFQRRPWL